MQENAGKDSEEETYRCWNGLVSGVMCCCGRRIGYAQSFFVVFVVQYRGEGEAGRMDVESEEQRGLMIKVRIFRRRASTREVGRGRGER